MSEQGLMVESYSQAVNLQPDWELWVGTGWVRIVGIVGILTDNPIIYADDGVGYQVDFLQAIRYRRPWWSAARSQGWGK